MITLSCRTIASGESIQDRSFMKWWNDYQVAYYAIELSWCEYLYWKLRLWIGEVVPGMYGVIKLELHFGISGLHVFCWTLNEECRFWFDMEYGVVLIGDEELS